MCIQAAGFAVLVVGTLIYSRGDQLEEGEEKQKDEAHPEAQENRRTVFKANNTIVRSGLHNIHRRRWRRAANALLAAARMQPDEEQPASH